jgi:hypothetical protein
MARREPFTQREVGPGAHGPRDLELGAVVGVVVVLVEVLVVFLLVSLPPAGGWAESSQTPWAQSAGVLASTT